jgi:hypothetical protein
MDSSSSSITSNATPKTLPMKYKAMLLANMSFINNHVADAALKELLYSKLPIFKTVAEQIAYFDEEADMKKVEQTLLKPMLKDQKQKEKEANKPVKAKKEKEPTKKEKAKKVNAPPAPVVADESVAEAEEETVVVKAKPGKKVLIPVIQIVITPTEVTISDKINNVSETLQISDLNSGEMHFQEEKELEFETEYPDAKGPAEPVVEEASVQEASEQEATPVEDKKKPKAPRKKKEKEEGEKVKAPPRKKKDVVVVVPVADTDDYFMIPTSVIPEGKFWTKDENYRNGAIYANGKDKDGGSAPGDVVGRLEDGNAIFEIV